MGFKDTMKNAKKKFKKGGKGEAQPEGKPSFKDIAAKGFKK